MFGFLSWTEIESNPTYSQCIPPMTKGRALYIGKPLSQLNSQTRATVCERIVRMYLNSNGNETVNAPITLTIAGNKRGRNTTECDFLSNGATCRNEVKSTVLYWNTDKNRWIVKWQCIKRSNYDTLYLVLYAPDGIYIYKHDDKTGISTTGKAQEDQGSHITFYGAYHSNEYAIIFEKLLPMLEEFIPF